MILVVWGDLVYLGGSSVLSDMCDLGYMSGLGGLVGLIDLFNLGQVV